MYIYLLKVFVVYNNVIDFIYLFVEFFVVLGYIGYLLR